MKICSQLHSFLYTQNKILPSNGILLYGVLIPKLLNKSFASWSFTNFDFLTPHSVHLRILEFKFLVFYTLHNKLACFVL